MAIAQYDVPDEFLEGRGHPRDFPIPEDDINRTLVARVVGDFGRIPSVMIGLNVFAEKHQPAELNRVARVSPQIVLGHVFLALPGKRRQIIPVGTLQEPGSGDLEAFGQFARAEQRHPGPITVGQEKPRLPLECIAIVLCRDCFRPSGSKFHAFEQ